MQVFTLTEGTQKIIKVTPKTPKGSIAKVDGKITFAMDTEGVILLLPNDDGSELTIQFGVNSLNPITVTATGDANLDPNAATNITSQFQVQTVAAAADHFDFVDGVETPV